jgi:glucose/arabinose dehydrogenase
MKTPYLILILSTLLATVHLKTSAQLTLGETPIDTLTVASRLDTPWEIIWGPDDHIWITERYGRISRLDPFSGALTEVAVFEEVHEQGEGGLLGMVLHPDFSSTPHVFVVYNYLDNSSIKERLVRYVLEANALTDPLILLDGIPGAGNHNGSRLAIDSLHYLYMTTGDAANKSTSQNLNSLNGKVLRLNLDGSIPEDNPLHGSPVWSWGHRNPQGLVFAPSGMLYSSEHGPSSDDEVNIIEKGRNYGWPQVKGFCDEVTETQFCADSGVYEPIAAWTPTLAVSGADYYAHSSLPEWTNTILVTSLKASRLVALKLSEDGRTVVNETQHFQNWFGRLRDLCVSPTGDVYLAVSNRDGRGTIRAGDDRIVKISPVSTVSNRGISEGEKDVAIRIYPNPLGGNEFMLEYTPSEKAVLTVYNEMGAEILSRVIYPGQSHREISLPASGGLYLLRIRDGNHIISRKLIKYE